MEQVPDRRGIEVIDIDEAAGSVAKIREIIDGDIYSSRLDAIKTCREWALRASNRYISACEIISESESTLPPKKAPELFRTLISKRKSEVYKLLNKISPDLADKTLISYCRKKGRFWE